MKFEEDRHQKQLFRATSKSFFAALIFCCGTVMLSAQSITLVATADAFLRNGSYSGNNYGRDTSLVVKSSTATGYTRSAYLKFSLASITSVNSAKLRLYGRNTENTATIAIASYGVSDSWTETGITFNNVPAVATSALASAGVTSQAKYYEFDVTNYVQAQFAGDKVVSFLVKNSSTQNTAVQFNSRENARYTPQLTIESGSVTQSRAKLFIENLNKVPSNELFVFSKIQVPWTRDGVTYNANHDSVTVRIHNKGMNTLVIKNLILSNATTWNFVKLKGVNYNPGTSLPLSISSGTYADLTVKFVAVDQATRVKILRDTLTIVSNDDQSPSKSVFFAGLWQKKGEGGNEPYAQEIISTFGFKTKTGFYHTDSNFGDTNTLKGDEIRPSYFVRADNAIPVSITQMGAYHGCCNATEKIMWYPKGTDSVKAVFTHIAKDGQTLLPRKSSPNTTAAGTFNPASAFGFKVGSKDYTDASKNPKGKIGIRVWKAFDAAGKIIPNSYIISNDYLGSEYTNYDYNDNTYLIKNIRPEKGTSYYSELRATPSAIEFGEKLLGTTNSFTLNLSNLGKSYTDGSKDPAIMISSIAIVGENKLEFSASMPAKTTLYAQEKTTLTVKFNPVSQGLKVADLLINYNNAQSPLRVPLYGIAKASGTTVTANYRINSGSATPITLNGKTWSADNQYSFDNLEPFTNSKLTRIAGTDEDPLYLKEQSSNAEKAPFRYEFPVANGDYVVRLHFAEIYWGAPGSGFNGGEGSRVMSVSVEGQLKLVNFDVTEAVGGATAIVKNIPVKVSDGKLNINFSASVNRPMVCAVEVYSFHSSSARPAPGLDNMDKVYVFPNPVENILSVQFPAHYKGNTVIQIVDVTGRKYDLQKMQLQPGGSNVLLNISSLSLNPGFYYLKIFSADTSDIIKLVVK